MSFAVPVINLPLMFAGVRRGHSFLLGRQLTHDHESEIQLQSIGDEKHVDLVFSTLGLKAYQSC